MSMWTGMGPDKPAPKMDPNCQCICHTQPGVMHVAACCSPPAALAASPEVQAQIREAEARGMERAAALPAYDSDGDPSGPFDHKVFVKIDAIRAAAAALRKDEETPK